MASTFQNYGGFSAVSRVVLSFYEMVLDSEIVGHHFDDVDMAKLMDHQTKFVSALMGGPTSISDEQLALVHRRLDITDAEFDEIVNLLGRAMTQNGMQEADVRDVEQKFNAKRSLVMSSGVR